MLRHIKTALFVGIILNLINQGYLLWGFQWSDIKLTKFVLTFFVPFAVSVYSAAQARIHSDKNQE
ncbi:MAG: nitrate/nitrite transporter NrtS [Bacteroidales bacterium]|nr:nitrate/nitrite transporter NrtS [Bacteroidales bacterium]